MTGSKPRNIVFVLTDQERYFGDYPTELEVPARRWLMDRGVTFTNHYIASTYCTSSRSVIYTGQHMPNTGMFDNATFEFVGSMSPRIPTVGTMLYLDGCDWTTHAEAAQVLRTVFSQSSTLIKGQRDSHFLTLQGRKRVGSEVAVFSDRVAGLAEIETLGPHGGVWHDPSLTA